MLALLLLGLVSVIDYFKQEFSELQVILFSILFLVIGLIQGFSIINFVVMFVLITILIKRGILYEGDYLISAFAFAVTASPLWLLLSLGLEYCLTIFYKELTKKTSTGFIPYFFLSVILLLPFILI